MDVPISECMRNMLEVKMQTFCLNDVCEEFFPYMALQGTHKCYTQHEVMDCIPLFSLLPCSLGFLPVGILCISLWKFSLNTLF